MDTLTYPKTSSAEGTSLQYRFINVILVEVPTPSELVDRSEIPEYASEEELDSLNSSLLFPLLSLFNIFSSHGKHDV